MRCVGQVLEMLIDCGARVTETDNDGRIALVLAAQEGHVACVKVLLDAASPVESRGHDGRTALRFVADVIASASLPASARPPASASLPASARPPASST